MVARIYRKSKMEITNRVMREMGKHKIDKTQTTTLIDSNQYNFDLFKK